MRNLRLLLVDDEDRLSTYRKDLPDIETFLPFDSAWSPNHFFENHCTAIALGEPLAYDLLTVDINFDLDDTDPAKALADTPPRSVPAGLLHGLAVLERRASRDASLNELPFAFSLRTRDPAVLIEHLRTRQALAETLRRFGLFRARLASPLGNDITLAQHIASEYQKRTGRDFPLKDPYAPLVEVLMEDLRGLSEEPGTAEQVISDLLWKWRDRFLQSVQDGDVYVSVDKLYATVKELQEEESVSPQRLRRHGLPISHFLAETDEVAYELSLASIFQDQTVRGRLWLPNAPTSFTDTAGRRHYGPSPVEWLDAVLDVANDERRRTPVTDALDRFRRVVSQTFRERNRPHRLADLWGEYGGEDRWRERTAIYAAYVTATFLEREQNPSILDPEYQVHDQYSPAELFGTSGRTLARFTQTEGFKEAFGPLGVGGLAGFYNALIATLADPDPAGKSLQGRELAWLLLPLREAALAPVREGGLGLSPEELSHYAPGLVAAVRPFTS